MEEITREAPADQICIWLQVADPAVPFVMEELRARGLLESRPRVKNQSPPLYYTALAFDLYGRWKGHLPPAAAQFVLDALAELQKAKFDAEQSRLLVEALRAERRRVADETAAAAAATKPAPLSTKAQTDREAAEAYARQHNLVTNWEIGEHYGRLDSDGSIQNGLYQLLRIHGLKPTKKRSGIYRLYRKAEVEAAAALCRQPPEVVKQWPG